MWYPVADQGQSYVAEIAGTGKASAAPQQAVTPAQVPSADDLSDWSQHFFSLSLQVAGKLGFGVGTANASYKDKVVIAEFSRSTPVTAADGKTKLIYGVALRLIIKVTDIEGSASLNLPMIAAETQLNRAQTESHLAVHGYVGEELSPLIPPWKQFDIEGYVELMQTITKIQQLISKDIDNVRPTLLQIYDPSGEVSDDEERARAVGTVWALTRIMSGDPCVDARMSFPLKESKAGLDAVEETYVELTGACDAGRPTQTQQEAARKELGRGARYF